MTQEEKNQKLFQVYAALGELSVLTKQNNQRAEQLAHQTNQFEEQLVELLKIEVKAPEVITEVPSVETNQE